MPARIWNFLSDEAGTTPIEYGMIATLIGIGLVTALSNLGAIVRALYSVVQGLETYM